MPEHQTGVADDDLVQLLYTSGTTSQPKGAMMTHRALVHEYVSSVHRALDLAADDEPLHSHAALPLGRRCTCSCCPTWRWGRPTACWTRPDVPEILRLIERDGITRCSSPRPSGCALANPPRLRRRRDLSSLRKAYYGASIMPVPVLERLRSGCPDVGFYNCFGQSEIAPLATVLRPEEHEERPGLVRARRCCSSRPGSSTPTAHDVPPGELGEVRLPLAAAVHRLLGQAGGDRGGVPGGWFHSGDLVRSDEEGYLFVVDRIKDVINTGGVLVASREVEDALYGHPAVAEVAVIGHPTSAGSRRSPRSSCSSEDVEPRR